ncbi:MAG: hypothetical protein NVSMB46_02250 [Candidatus Saccharimonadales bacterium]
MNPELGLTEEQIEMANFMIEECGLQDYAELPLEMMGARGTVWYGLGRCAQHLTNCTPEEIKTMVVTLVSSTTERN